MGRHTGTMGPKAIASEMVQHMISERWSKVASVEVATKTPVQETRVPILHEYCDLCGAKAYYAVEFGTYDESVYGGIKVTGLFFCGHHANKYEEHLNKNGTVIGTVDERWAIALRD